VQNLLQQFSGENIIIGGDFNCPFPKDDREGGRDLSSSRKLSQAKHNHGIIEIYCQPILKVLHFLQ